VIVQFDTPVPPSEIRPDPASLAPVRARIGAVQDAINSAHFGSPTDPIPGQGFDRGLTRFLITPGFAISATAAELDSHAADPRVMRIQYDRPERPVLIQSVPLIGMLNAYSAGATGAGQAVVVINTGVQADEWGDDFRREWTVQGSSRQNGGARPHARQSASAPYASHRKTAARIVSVSHEWSGNGELRLPLERGCETIDPLTACPVFFFDEVFRMCKRPCYR
jgi:hypothetical protein